MLNTDNMSLVGVTIDYGPFGEACVLRGLVVVVCFRGWGHGVLNTDHMSLVGVTINYGPFGEACVCIGDGCGTSRVAQKTIHLREFSARAPSNVRIHTSTMHSSSSEIWLRSYFVPALASKGHTNRDAHCIRKCMHF